MKRLPTWILYWRARRAASEACGAHGVTGGNRYHRFHWLPVWGWKLPARQRMRQDWCRSYFRFKWGCRPQVTPRATRPRPTDRRR